MCVHGTKGRAKLIQQEQNRNAFVKNVFALLKLSEWQSYMIYSLRAYNRPFIFNHWGPGNVGIFFLIGFEAYKGDKNVINGRCLQTAVLFMHTVKSRQDILLQCQKSASGRKWAP